ncbi:MAG TPA: hypothetical protein VGO43_13100 [Pyrinomonadaceae bacterium]|jgi:hypothetical protein|nr:hypothetical protein [Pyrinomonadaceae bacterium]
MKRSSNLLLIAIVALVAIISADAQTRRTKPRPLATPVPSLSGAEIISQAGDYDPAQAQPQPTETPKKTTSTSTARYSELTERVKKLESTQASTYDEKQKRMLLNLDILTRAEQRTESLRKQLFEMIEKENSVKSRMDQIDYESRPEIIERALQVQGSMKPEEVRENRRKQLTAEKGNLQSLLTQIQSTRSQIETSLAKAEDMVAKLRTKLEKDIDESFLKDDIPDKPDEQL